MMKADPIGPELMAYLRQQPRDMKARDAVEHMRTHMDELPDTLILELATAYLELLFPAPPVDIAI